MPLFRIFPKNQALQWLFELPLSLFSKEDPADLPVGTPEFTDQILKGIFENPTQRC